MWKLKKGRVIPYQWQWNTWGYRQEISTWCCSAQVSLGAATTPVIQACWQGCCWASVLIVGGQALHRHRFHWWAINLQVLQRTACLSPGDCQLWVASDSVVCILGAAFKRTGGGERVFCLAKYCLKQPVIGLQEDREQGTRAKMVLCYSLRKLQSPSLATDACSFRDLTFCLGGLSYLLRTSCTSRPAEGVKVSIFPHEYGQCGGNQLQILVTAVCLPWMAAITAWVLPYQIPSSVWTESLKALGSIISKGVLITEPGWHQPHTNGSQCAAESGLYVTVIQSDCGGHLRC